MGFHVIIYFIFVCIIYANIKPFGLCLNDRNAMSAKHTSIVIVQSIVYNL